MRTGFLGGTFDPVHLGHLVLGESAREQLSLDRVLFVPTGHSWRKPDRVITPAEHRVTMLRLAIEDNAAFDVSLLEVERPGPSYTVVTLEQMKAERPEEEIFFILGRDALADLPHWHRPERILALATLAVADRPGAAEPGAPLPEARLQAVDMPAIGITGTDLRERVRDGRSVRYQVPASVEAYIRRHRLYVA